MGRKSYTDEFRAQACKLVTVERYSKSEVCRKLGVSYQTLHDWLMKSRPAVTPTQPIPESPDAMRARIKELEKQLAMAEQEREILKKATAYFARQNP